MYHFYVQGGRGGKGDASACHYHRAKEKYLDLQTKLNGNLTGVNLVYINSVNIGSINKDDISKLLCLSVLLNVTKPI